MFCSSPSTDLLPLCLSLFLGTLFFCCYIKWDFPPSFCFWYFIVGVKNAFNFWILTSYPTILANSCIKLSSFLVEFIEFSMYIIMSPANSDSFASSFPIWMPFIPFPCLITVSRTSNSMLNESGERGHPYFVPNLSGKAFSFCLLSMMLAVGLSYMNDLYYVEGCSLYSHFAECFYHKLVLYLIKCFFHIYWYDNVPFVCAVVYVVYYAYWFVNIVPSLYPWVNPTWSWCMIFLMYYCMRFANMFFRILASMFINGIGLKFSFFVMSLSGFGISMMLAS